MKKVIFIILLLSIESSSLKAQYSKSDIEKAKVEIKLLSNRWDKAIEKRDSTTLEKILAPQFSVYTTNIFDVPPTANHGLRKQWLDNTLHRVLTDTLEVIGEQKITFFGMAAKCEQQQIWKGHWNNELPFIYEFDVTDIWVKTKNSWQVLYRMSYVTKAQDNVKP